MKSKEVIFDGPFKKQCYQFLQYKRSLGFKYLDGPDLAVKRMDDFFKKYELTEILLTKEMVEDFTSKKGHEANNTIYKRQHLIKEFAEFLKKNNFNNIYVFNDEYIDGKSYYIPYVFSYKEIKEIFNYYDNLEYCSRSKKQHIIYPILIRLLYSCGFRIGEVTELKIDNVDLKEGIITVINGKGNISRRVPLSNSMYIVLEKYIKSMNFITNEDYLFPSSDGNKYNKQVISKHFKNAIKKLNINSHATLHSLRHTFAVHSLEKMVNEGQDIYCSLPILSQYLGHSNITSTEHYLRLTNENYQRITNASILNEFGGINHEQ